MAGFLCNKLVRQDVVRLKVYVSKCKPNGKYFRMRNIKFTSKSSFTKKILPDKYSTKIDNTKSKMQYKYH